MACDRAGDSAAPPAEPPTPGATTEAAPGTRIVFLGDSLTAGFGLGEEAAFPALVERSLLQSGFEVHVQNAGVSGDTSAGGVNRLSWILRQQPDIVVLELGGNDGLRALDLGMTEGNLRQIIQECRQAGADVLLAGMLIPPNYGPDYAGAFEAIYPRLAEELDVPLIPFLLEGVGGVPQLNLPDGIHPNAEGHQRVAQNVLPYLEEMLRGRETQS